MRRSSILLAFAILTVLAAAAHAAEFKDVHKVVPIDANGRVTLDAHNGSVTITAWNQANVSIDARIEPVEHFDFDHPEDVQKTEVRVSGGGKNVDIESDYSAVPSHVSLLGIQQSYPPIHYTINVPANAQLRIKTHNATVTVTAVKGDVEVETHNGNVDLTDIDGGASLETHNGDVRVVFASVARPSRIETHNGSASVVVPAAARMTVTVDSHRSSAFASDLPVTVKASGSTSSSLVNGGGTELKFFTHNGSMHLSRR
jgi:hypothetical protein